MQKVVRSNGQYTFLVGEALTNGREILRKSFLSRPHEHSLVNVGHNCPLTSIPSCCSFSMWHPECCTSFRPPSEASSFYQNKVPNLYGALKGSAQSVCLSSFIWGTSFPVSSAAIMRFQSPGYQLIVTHPSYPGVSITSQRCSMLPSSPASLTSPASSHPHAHIASCTFLLKHSLPGQIVWCLSSPLEYRPHEGKSMFTALWQALSPVPGSQGKLPFLMDWLMIDWYMDGIEGGRVKRW